MPALTKKAIILIIIICSASVGTFLGIYFVINVTVEQAMENAEVNVNSIEILSADNDTLTVRILGNITNPSGSAATLQPMTLTVNYQGASMGTTQTTTIEIQPTTTLFNQTCDVTITNRTLFGLFMADFIKKANLDLTLSGLASITAAGMTFQQNIVKTISMAGMNNEFNVTLLSFSIINASSTNFNASVLIEVKNPSSTTLNLENVLFNVSWQAKTLGELYISHLKIISGTHNTSLIGMVKIYNLTLFDEMADTILNNTDVELNFKGKTSDSNILASYFSELDLNVIIPGLETFDCVILSIELKNSSDNSFTLDVELEIYNPTSGPVDISNVTFNTYYCNELLGLVNFSDLTVESGRKTYLLTVEFILTNASLLSDILTNYLNGNDIEITFIGAANGTDIISSMVDGYKQNITLPASPAFNYTLGSLDLVGSTATTLILNSTITVNNPTPLNVTLVSLFFNATYENSWVGNVTAGPINLRPGQNVIPIQIILSGDVNKSAIEDLLSKHINHISITLNLTGYIRIKIAGMNGTINTTLNFIETLAGVQDDLIQQTRLYMITVDYSVPKMIATVKVTAYNPFDFEINITYLSYDAYFDDPDGAHYLLINYDPDYNIYIDSVAENHSSSPIQMSALGTKDLDANISNFNYETCFRLWCEYEIDRYLEVDILNGKMQVTIGAFQAWISFAYPKIHVQ